jgi:hypothetical protein
LSPQNPTRHIIALAQQLYSWSRREIEAELAEVTKAAEKFEMCGNSGEEPSDPPEGDLVKQTDFTAVALCVAQDGNSNELQYLDDSQNQFVQGQGRSKTCV